MNLMHLPYCPYCPSLPLDFRIISSPSSLSIKHLIGMCLALFCAITSQAKEMNITERSSQGIQKALDELETFRKTKPKEAVTLQLSPGEYRLTGPIILTAKHASKEFGPLTLAGKKDASVILNAAQRITASDFKPITDPDTLKRIHPDATGKLLVLDLKALGITVPTYPPSFDGNQGMLNLYVNKALQPLSTYPNEASDYGSMTFEKVLRNGDKNIPGIFQYRKEHDAAHARWAKAIDRGVWIKGYFRVVWQNNALKVKSIDTAKRAVEFAAGSNGGIGNKYQRPDGNGQEIYWVLNLLEEVDIPGEWAVDFQSQKLYLYPPANKKGEPDFSQSEIELSVSDKPIILLEDTHNVTLERLTLEMTKGDGIQINQGTGNRVRGCEIRRVARNAIWLNQGIGHEVLSCELHELGAGGVMVQGGDAKTNPRTPCKHHVVNNHIHHFAKFNRVYAAGVSVGYKARQPTVGAYVAHNLIHDTPHVGILFEGYDSIFEFNEILRFAEVSNDMGGIYSYYKAASSGHEIIRKNFIHSSLQGDGIYYDNEMNHATVSDNVVFRMAHAEDANRGIGVLLKNINSTAPKGSNCVVERNWISECAVGLQAAVDENWTLRANRSVKNKIPYKNMGKLAWDAADLGNTTEDSAPLPSVDHMGLFLDKYRTGLPDIGEKTLAAPPRKTGKDGYSIGDRITE